MVWTKHVAEVWTKHVTGLPSLSMGFEPKSRFGPKSNCQNLWEMAKLAIAVPVVKFVVDWLGLAVSIPVDVVGDLLGRALAVPVVKFVGD